MTDSKPSSVRHLLAAMGLAAVSATPGCIFAVGNPAPPPFDAGPDEPDAGRDDDAGAPEPNADAGASADDAGASDAGAGDAAALDAGTSGDDGG